MASPAGTDRSDAPAQGLAIPEVLPDADLIGNRNFWTDYAWPEAGDEWSEHWGSSRAMWLVTLFPRLSAFLPAGHILEIAPGFGRVTNYLRQYCRSMTIVDLTPRCIEHCRVRFARDTHIRSYVNDGRSLDMVPSDSVDLAVSWDSLVHVEHETLRAYIQQLARVLKPGGVAFVHHSNLGVHAHELIGDEPGEVVGGRRKSATAAKARADAASAGLRVLAQEIIPWNDNGLWMDAFTLLTRDVPGAPIAPEPAPVFRHDWPAELAQGRRITELYHRPPAMPGA